MIPLAAVLFVAAHMFCTLAGPVQEAPVLSYERRKCARMFPWRTGERVSRCTYRCMGFFRWENEQDGVSCMEFPNGVCVNGRCVDGDLYRSTDTVTPPATTSTSSYDHPSPKPEVGSTTHKSWTGRRQSNQPVFTTLRPDKRSSSPSFQTMYAARTATPKYPISEIGIASGGTASSMNNKSTQPFSSTTRIAEITRNRNRQTASESTSTSPSFKPSEQHASTRLRYDEKHTAEPTRTEDSSRGRSSTFRRHVTTYPISGSDAPSATHVTQKPTQSESVSSTRSAFSGPLTTPTVPASEASSTIPADASPSVLRNKAPGVTAAGSQPADNSKGTTPTPTTGAAFISVRHGGTSVSPDTDRAAPVISHEHVFDRHPTTTCSDFGSNVWSTLDESRAVSGVPRVTSSTKRDTVTETTQGNNEVAENGSVPTATASAVTQPTNNVALLQTRDPSSFELSIEINVKGRLPFLKHQQV